MKEEKKRVIILSISALGLIILAFIMIIALRYSNDDVLNSGSAIELREEFDLRSIQ